MTDSENDTANALLIRPVAATIDPIDPADMRDIWRAVAEASKAGDMKAA